MKPILLLLTIAVAALTVTAQKTTRAGLHAKSSLAEASSTAIPETAEVDTVVNPAHHQLDINGYDKPLRSRRETFFVTNNTKQATKGVAVTITYFDSKNRQLHKRSAHLPLQIPAGETRQASLKSWDEQQSFYYEQSSVPARVDVATPYSVKIAVDTIFFAR